MTLVVRLARGAKILEEFIVPSTSLPSTNPDGSVEFNNDTSTCPFSESSPLYRDTPVTLSRDVTFIWIFETTIVTSNKSATSRFAENGRYFRLRPPNLS